jgi:tetratricopeptide (TPR) repeat protein
MADIFISYSKQDPEPTHKLAAELERRGYSVWWDTGLLSGTNFREVILRELSLAKAVIVIWTPSSVNSDWAKSEADRAQLARKLVPLRLPEVKIHDIPPPFGRMHTDVIGDIDTVLRALAALGAEPSADGAAQFVDLGNVRFQALDLDNAIGEYTKAIDLNPNYGIAYHNRGVAYLHENQPNLAIADFNMAIQLDRKDARSYCNRGFTFKTLGNFGRAITDYTRAIELNPNYALSYDFRGDAYYEREAWACAIADYSEALELEPNNSEIYYKRGAAYRMNGEYRLAVEDLTKAIALQPEDADFYDARGIAYEKLGDKARAAADLQHAHSIEPDRKYYYLRRGAVFRVNPMNVTRLIGE